MHGWFRWVVLIGAGTHLLIATGCDALADAQGASSIFAIGAPVSPEEAARMAINPYNADERARGTILLANSWFGGEEIYIRLYTDNISDWDAGVRAASVRALAMHGLPEHAPLVIARLDDESERVRLEAARALQRIHSPDAVEPLLRHITEPSIAIIEESSGEADPTVRAEAAHALGQYAEPRVIEGLIRALDDRHLAVNIAARNSLRTLTGKDFGQDRADWLAWYETAEDPFRGRTAYVYPVFNRGRRLVEFIPLVPPPPNEVASTPTGMPPVRRSRDSSPDSVPPPRATDTPPLVEPE